MGWIFIGSLEATPLRLRYGQCVQPRSGDYGNAASLIGIYVVGRCGSPGSVTKEIEMNLRKWSGLALTAVLAMGMSAEVASAQQDTGATQDMQNAGHATKDAVVDTGHGIDKGAHKAYHTTKHGTKRALRSTKYHTKRAAHKIHNTVDPDTTTAPPQTN
jgi:hypothetical protein